MVFTINVYAIRYSLSFIYSWLHKVEINKNDKDYVDI